MTEDLPALAAAATPGPWEERGAFVDRLAPGPDSGWRAIAETDYVIHEAGRHPQYPDAAFIVALVNAYRAGELVELDAAVREQDALRTVHRERLEKKVGDE